MNTFDTKWGLESGQIGDRKTAMILISWTDMRDSALMEKERTFGEKTPFSEIEKKSSPRIPFLQSEIRDGGIEGTASGGKFFYPRAADVRPVFERLKASKQSGSVRS